MALIHWRSLAAAFILLSFGRTALGGEYSDPNGFSFTYPDGWVAITKAAMGDVKQALPAEVKNWVSKNNLDFWTVVASGGI